MIWRVLLIGAIAGIMALFLVFYGYEVLLDWKRGRRVRKIYGDRNCADDAVESLQIQAELDEALLKRGLRQMDKRPAPKLRIV